MRILITGSGGREHALIKKLLQNEKVHRIYCAPGNGGTALEDRCENIPVLAIQELVDFALKNEVDLVVPGSEDMLVAGIVDEFRRNEIPILGPHRKAALLEGSKCLAKDFMRQYGIKSAEYRNFHSIEAAAQYLEHCHYPVVLKADGLAMGKGVLICQDKAEARIALNQIMKERRFGSAGDSIVIEEFLEGVEASILSFYDGKTILPLLSAKDHKKIGEGERGPNTGGMGAVVPNPHVDDAVMKDFHKDILLPTLEGLEAEGLQFCGVIFFGLMINRRGVFLLEYNLRMGDPETQAVLALLDSDLLELIENTLSAKLESTEIRWREGSSCCVVMASGAYPDAYEKGLPIENIAECESDVCIAGAVLNGSELLTSGGRVLNVTACGPTLQDARKKCYRDVAKIHFPNKVFRRDIGGSILF